MECSYITFRRDITDLVVYSLMAITFLLWASKHLQFLCFLYKSVIVKKQWKKRSDKMKFWKITRCDLIYAHWTVTNFKLDNVFLFSFSSSFFFFFIKWMWLHWLTFLRASNKISFQIFWSNLILYTFQNAWLLCDSSKNSCTRKMGDKRK